jgi:hypothetical protein
MINELKMIYNVKDDKYYFYYGDDFLIDTKTQEVAFKYFELYKAFLIMESTKE